MTKCYAKAGDQVLVLESLDLPKKPKKVAKPVGHHIMVIDRSGSMYGDIDKLKSSIEQSLAVNLARRETEAPRTTLISFSSNGDVTLHWDSIPADQVCDSSYPYRKILQGIQATYLTGISQGLNLALTKVKDGQVTCITLFTDGYANDPSPTLENKNLEAFVEKASKVPNLFVNCIGYRDWCDWPRMQSISNALSGKTLKATSFSTVLEAMSDTLLLLSTGTQPALIIEKNDYDLLVAINRTSGQVNATHGDLALQGVGSKDNVEVYGVALKDSPPRGVTMISKDNAWLYGALVNGFTSLGDYATAKGLLHSSGNKTLWEAHQTAMTPSSLAEMTNDMFMWVKLGNNVPYTMGKNTKPKYSLFDLADTFTSMPEKSLGLSDTFYDNYRRRSESKADGKRLDDGTIAPLRAKANRIGQTYITGMSFNSNDATVQLSTAAHIEIIKVGDTDPVREVAYIPLDQMREYRSYTLISSGERNVEKFDVEVYTKDAWKGISPFLTAAQAKKVFKAGMTVTINLKQFSLIPDEAFSLSKMTTAIQGLHAATAEVKLLSAMQDKVEAASYTKEQIEALDELHISSNLYFNPPSHAPFAGKEARQAAISTGKIDSYVRYKVYFGTVDILSDENFRSGNEFLQRYYEVTLKGEDVKKAKLSTYLQGAEYLPRTPKGAVTAADELMKTFFNKYIGLKIEKKTGTVKTAPANKRMNNDKIVAALAGAKNDQDKYRRTLNALVMYIGCTGLIPNEIASKFIRYEPDDFAAKFSKVLGKDDKEGIFYVYDDKFVISVTPETSWYTT